METRRNYLLVGAFVVAGCIGFFVFLIWLSGGRDNHDFQAYHIYFKESVNGLNLGSAVKYRGVEVGKVARIVIDPSDTRRIEVTANLYRDAPIKKNTFATLKFQGITGLVYIELTGGSKDSPPVEVVDKEIPTIPAKESQLSQVVTTLPEIAGKFSKISDRLLLLLDDKNIAAFNQTMQQLQTTTTELSTLITKTGDAMKHINASAENVEHITQNSRKDAEAAVKEANRAMQQLSELLEKTNQFSGAGYDQLYSLLLELKKTAREVRGFSKELKDEPASIITPVKTRGVKVP